MQPMHPSKAVRRILTESETNRTVQVAAQQEPCSLDILVITWNMMGGLPTPKTLSFLLSPERLTADVLVIGTQQCEKTLLMSFFSNSKDCWEKLLCDYLYVRGFSLIDSEKLHGLHIIAFAKSNKMSYLQSTRSGKVKTGLYGTLGNKGAVSLTFNICKEPFQFINAHLPSSHNHCGQRNEHLAKITEKLIDWKKNQNVVFFGDMNYRLNVSGEESKSICSFVSNNQLSYEDYAKNDQLLQQEQLRQFHQLFSQGSIKFPPTYKLSCEDNTYIHSRITGWTDRIFFNSRENKMRLQDYYSDMYVMGSDHRPVFALFMVSINPQYVPVAKNPNQKKSQSRCLFL